MESSGKECSGPLRLRLRKSEMALPAPDLSAKDPPPLKLWIPLKRRRLSGDGPRGCREDREHHDHLCDDEEQEGEDMPEPVEEREFVDRYGRDAWQSDNLRRQMNKHPSAPRSRTPSTSRQLCAAASPDLPWWAANSADSPSPQPPPRFFTHNLALHSPATNPVKSKGERQSCALRSSPTWPDSTPISPHEALPPIRSIHRLDRTAPQSVAQGLLSLDDAGWTVPGRVAPRRGDSRSGAIASAAEFSPMHPTDDAQNEDSSGSCSDSGSDAGAEEPSFGSECDAFRGRTGGFRLRLGRPAKTDAQGTLGGPGLGWGGRAGLNRHDSSKHAARSFGNGNESDELGDVSPTAQAGVAEGTGERSQWGRTAANAGRGRDLQRASMAGPDAADVQYAAGNAGCWRAAHTTADLSEPGPNTHNQGELRAIGQRSRLLSMRRSGLASDEDGMSPPPACTQHTVAGDTNAAVGHIRPISETVASGKAALETARSLRMSVGQKFVRKTLKLRLASDEAQDVRSSLADVMQRQGGRLEVEREARERARKRYLSTADSCEQSVEASRRELHTERDVTRNLLDSAGTGLVHARQAAAAKGNGVERSRRVSQKSSEAGASPGGGGRQTSLVEAETAPSGRIVLRLASLRKAASTRLTTPPATANATPAPQNDAKVDVKAVPDPTPPSNVNLRPCFCGHVSSPTSSTSGHVPCSTPGCRTILHLVCMGLSSPHRQHFCPSCRFKLVEAFWHPVENLLATKQAYITPLSTRLEQGTMTVDRILTFSLTPQTVKQLNSGGSSRMKLRLACVHLADTQPYRCHWPRQATLEVNGCTKKLFKRDAAKQLPDTQFDEAADISAMVKAGTNTMRLKFRTTRRFMLQLSLCKSRSMEEVKQLICAAPTPKEAHTAMKQRVGAGDEVGGDDSDSDLVDSGSLVLSLRCPLMGCRIKTPVIFKDKPGLPAMDLDSFLAVAKQTSRPLTCPHSRRHVAITQLQPDVYLQRVLQCLQSSCHSEVTEVEVDKDGKWRPAGCDSNPWWSVLDDPLQPYPSKSPSSNPAVDPDEDVVDLCDSDEGNACEEDEDDDEFNALYNSSVRHSAGAAAGLRPASLSLKPTNDTAFFFSRPAVSGSPDVECISSSSGQLEMQESPDTSNSSGHGNNPLDDFLNALFGPEPDDTQRVSRQQESPSRREWPLDGVPHTHQPLSLYLPSVVSASGMGRDAWPTTTFGIHPSTPVDTSRAAGLRSMAGAQAHQDGQPSPFSGAFIGLLPPSDPVPRFSPFSVPSPTLPVSSSAALSTGVAAGSRPFFEDAPTRPLLSKPPGTLHSAATTAGTTIFGPGSLLPLSAPPYASSMTAQPALTYSSSGTTPYMASEPSATPLNGAWAGSNSNHPAPHNLFVPSLYSSGELDMEEGQGGRTREGGSNVIDDEFMHWLDEYKLSLCGGGARGKGRAVGALTELAVAGERAGRSRIHAQPGSRIQALSGTLPSEDVDVVDLLDESD